ncbi:MAG: penicillin-binding protein 1C [Proteobacteria bacterium]|nr:penicillin-binding protein 1C [Pseudomonadota bacterium]
MKRRLAGLLAVLTAAVLIAFAWPVDSLPPPSDAPVVLDRNGHTIAREGTPDRAMGSPVDRVPKWVELTLLAAEDHRFRTHVGIDPTAIVRAANANLRAGEVAQGGSTITQQLVRTVWPRRTRWLGKLDEAWTAVRLELRTDKDTILLEYANRVYFGRNAYGIDAAALQFFDKSPETLSLSEAAMLAALPRRPAAHDPFEHPDQALDARNSVLLRLDELGWADVEDALATPLEARSAPIWRDAPHFVRHLEAARDSQVETTLDLELQRRVEEIIEGQLRQLDGRNVTNAAVLVVDRASAGILAYVGSADWSAEAGQVDGVQALRSPGSALKPFVYELALAEEHLTLASLVDDLPGAWTTTHGTYRPTNYDESFYGRIRVREALATSRNLPAVRVLEQVGLAELHMRLRLVGFRSLEERPGHYGLALALGDGEVSLYELVEGYLALASGGRHRALRSDRAAERVAPVQVLDGAASGLVLDVLDDPDARARAFGVDSVLEPSFPMAAKTGTSVGWRDNWAMGVTPEHVIGVWVGNADNSPMQDVSGVTGAGPILRAVAEEAYTSQKTELYRAELVKGPICPDTGLRRGDSCPHGMPELFAPGTVPDRECDHDRDLDPPARLVSPDDASTYYLEGASLPLRATGPRGTEFVWLADGVEVGRGEGVRWAASDGEHDVELLADGESVARHHIWVRSSPDE